jgi:hypothetical protein
MDFVRLRPGRTARILDVSPTGALVETAWPLSPGTRVELQVGATLSPRVVKGTIVRCHVAALDRQGISYRGAVAFEEVLPLNGE